MAHPKGKTRYGQALLLADKSLPWWAVGASLIAANISAEQFIGMSGSGYVVGLAIASYELMAALAIIIVAKYFLPVFLRNGIYTMPQFLQERYDPVRTVMAIFWVLLFVFVNITSVLYLGGLVLQDTLGIPMWICVIGLALYAASIFNHRWTPCSGMDRGHPGGFVMGRWIYSHLSCIECSRRWIFLLA
jgi:SSS family solute:Na+ symporter